MIDQSSDINSNNDVDNNCSLPQCVGRYSGTLDVLYLINSYPWVSYLGM